MIAVPLTSGAVGTSVRCPEYWMRPAKWAKRASVPGTAGGAAAAVNEAQLMKQMRMGGAKSSPHERRSDNAMPPRGAVYVIVTDEQSASNAITRTSASDKVPSVAAGEYACSNC